MTPQQTKRLTSLGLCFLGALGLGIFIFSALQENLMYFATPGEILRGEVQGGTSAKQLRLGGVVEKGSITKDPQTLSLNFVVTDLTDRLQVSYKGVTPDLFREGQGVIAEGHVEGDVFVASKILAKHDENYRPPILGRK
jgi:cytochrome c-type biogenesis protein CcmE